MGTTITRNGVADLAAQPRSFPFCDLTTHGGSALLGAASGGVLGRQTGPWGTGDNYLISEAATSGTKTGYCLAFFVLPKEYVAGGAVTITIHARYATVAGSPTVGTAEVDLEAYDLDAEGNDSGGDINATAAIAVTASWADKVFTITPTNLVAGDKLNFFIKAVIQETAASGSVRIEIGSITVKLQMKG